MAFKKIDIATQSGAAVYQDSHITLDFLMKKDDTKVAVTSPQFTLRDSDGNAVIDLYVITDIHKRSSYPDDVGWYRTTFITTGLVEGTYTAKVTGTYGVEELSQEGTIVLKSIRRGATHVNTLRGMMMDKYNDLPPRRYMTRDPKYQEFEEGDLWDALNWSLGVINDYHPYTIVFTLDNIPCASILLLGAQCYLMTNKSLLAVANEFSVNFPTGISYNTKDSYVLVARWIAENFFERAKDWKRMYNWLGLRPIVWSMAPFPVRYARALSMDASGGWNIFGY